MFDNRFYIFYFFAKKILILTIPINIRSVQIWVFRFHLIFQLFKPVQKFMNSFCILSMDFSQLQPFLKNFVSKNAFKVRVIIFTWIITSYNLLLLHDSELINWTFPNLKCFLNAVVDNTSIFSIDTYVCIVTFFTRIYCECETRILLYWVSISMDNLFFRQFTRWFVPLFSLQSIFVAFIQVHTTF